ncbi:MAG: flagellar type III secretion system protein FliR [Candidatus Latescibacteria bacterium]|nr:flagellar type III secretion system protein FliR [Candidatus Latescibacterota bacterium]
MDIPLDLFLRFLLIFCRVSAVVMFIPIFGDRTVPFQAQAAIGFALSLILVPLVPTLNFPSPEHANLFWLVSTLLREVMIGVILGFIVVLLFAGVQMAGQIVGLQIGFGIVNVLDPQSDLQVPIIGQLNFLLALMLFLSIDGHHTLIQALSASYDLIPIGKAHFSDRIAEQFIRLSGGIFSIALKLGAPVMIVLLLTNVALGIIARTVPQMNVFIVGFPLQIGLGLLAIAFSFSLFSYVFLKEWGVFQRELVTIIKLLGH